MSYLLLVSLLTLPCASQTDLVTLAAEQVKVAKSGGYAMIRLPFEIKEGYHIQAPEVSADNLIATAVTLRCDQEALIFDTSFDAYNTQVLTLGELSMDVITGHFVLVITVKGNIKRELENNLQGTVRYQACDDRRCYFPRDLPFRIVY